MEAHLSDPPSGGAEQVDLVVSPPVGGVDHADPPPQLGVVGLPDGLLVHGVQPLLQHLHGLAQALLVAVTIHGDLDQS